MTIFFFHFQKLSEDCGERKSPKEIIFFHISLCSRCLSWCLNHDLLFNQTTHYVLDRVLNVSCVTYSYRLRITDCWEIFHGSFYLLAEVNRLQMFKYVHRAFLWPSFQPEQLEGFLIRL